MTWIAKAFPRAGITVRQLAPTLRLWISVLTMYLVSYSRHEFSIYLIISCFLMWEPWPLVSDIFQKLSYTFTTVKGLGFKIVFCLILQSWVSKKQKNMNCLNVKKYKGSQGWYDWCWFYTKWHNTECFINSNRTSTD